MRPFDEGFLRTLSALTFAVSRMRAKEGGGSRLADRRGGRMEFADHRAYAPGDDIRDVDWPAHARTGRLYVKEYERRDDAEVVVLVDASASMGFHGKLDAAVRIAWALAWVALGGGGGARIGLAADGGLRLSPRARSRARIEDVSSVLAGAQAAGGTKLSESLAALPAATRGARVVVLLSDLLAEDDGRRALASCVRRGDTVGVLHLVAGDDWAVPDDGATLVDAETGERVAVDAGSSARAARREAGSEREWAAFAARHRIRYVRADAAAPAEETVLRALRRGGVLA